MTEIKKSTDMSAQPSLREWVISRGMFGFGPAFALLMLVWDIYSGRILDWDIAKWEIAGRVFVAGPLWGLFMWYIVPRVNAWHIRRDA